MTDDDLFLVLLRYDPSWQLVYAWNDGVILQNGTGSNVTGNTLRAALLTALMVYRDEEEHATYRD